MGKNMGSFNKQGLTLISAWISKYINYKAWDEITNPFPNFNGATVEIWEWISRSTKYVVTTQMQLCVWYGIHNNDLKK